VVDGKAAHDPVVRAGVEVKNSSPTCLREFTGIGRDAVISVSNDLSQEGF